MRDPRPTERAERIDDVLAVSRFHQTHLLERYPFLAPDKVGVIRNGITPSYFTAEPPPDRRRRVVCSSSPDRGLDLLLEMWSDIRRLVPDADLVHTYPPVYDRIADQDPDLAKFRERIEELAGQPGVTSFTGLSQPKLAELMRSSLVWAHPSWNTIYGVPIHEVSCIGAMEAQAAGCCVVASSFGALPETVQCGQLIDGRRMTGGANGSSRPSRSL